MKKIYNRNWLFTLKSIAVFGSMLFAGAASAQLSGTYTIDSSMATNMATMHFQSPQDFADSINLHGVSGAVVVNVAANSGPYDGLVRFTASGTATNTITFNGNGNTFTRNTETVFNLNGCDYFTFDNLVVDARGTSNGARCFWIHNDADNNTISNSDLTLSAYTGTNTSTAYVAFSNSNVGRVNGNHGSNNVIDNNIMHGNGTGSGPYNGISDYRSSANRSLDDGNTISNNTITDCYYGHTYLWYTGGCDINNNTFGTIRSSSAATYYANRIYQCGFTANAMKFNDNTITGLNPSSTLYATYFYYNDGVSPANPMQVNGNKILNCAPGANFYGLRAYYNTNAEYINNEVANNTGNGCYDMYIYMYNEDNVVIEDNYIHNNTSLNTHYTMYNYMNQGSNLKINRNRIIDNASGSYLYNYMVYYGDNIYATNNIIAGNSALYYCYNFCYYPGSGAYAHNTIVMTEAIDYYNYALYCWFNASTTGFDIVNNIVTVGGTSSFGYTQYGLYAGGTLTNVNWEKNVYNHDGANANYQNGSNYTSAINYVASTAETGSIAADPLFTNVATNDFTPTNPVISNIGIPGVVADDITLATRTACGPDPGAIEFFVDHSASALSTLPATECGGYEYEVSVRFQNGTAIAMDDVEMFYSVDGGTPVVEVIPTAAASTSTDLTFATKAEFNGAGTHTITIGLGCDDDASNNTATQTVVITPSPFGSDFAMGSQFDGYFNAGTDGDPDATVNGYISEYDIATVADASASVTHMLSVTDETMTDVTTSGFTLTPIGTNGAATLSANPLTSLAGKKLNMAIMFSEAATGCDTTINRTMYIPHTPVTDFDAADICLGDVAQFKNQSTLAASNYDANYIISSWTFDDPDPSVTDDFSSIKDGFWEYTTYGSGVNVEMTVANGLYPKFEYMLAKTINVTPKPEIDFKVLNACEGIDITVINNTSISTASPITYMWDFGGEYSSTATTPSYTFATPGQREITVIAESNGCVAELTKNAYQFETPVADFVSEGVCNFVDVEFNSTSMIPNNGNMGYKWNFNNEGISRAQAPAYAFATPGTKTVELIATSEFGCENAVTKTITLNESPEADFTWDAACNLTPVNFTMTGSVPDGGMNSTFNWDFNGESTTIQENPTFEFPRVGSKQVTLNIVDLNGCSNSITKEVNVVLQAVADFDVQNVCQGSETQFTGKSTVAAGDLTYVWTFGDNSDPNSDHSPKHTYAEAKSYNVTLEAIVAGGCSDVISKSVFVNPSPDATFTYVRSGRDVSFTATDGGNDEYIWRFGNGGSAFTANPSYSYENVDQGTFTVCLAAKKGICPSESCQEVTIDMVGIEDLTVLNDMINVYPNPTTGKFNVTVENAGDVVVKVGDILGNVITANVIDNLNGTYSVDMSAVADGVYFVQVKNGDYFATKRITVSK